MFADKKQTESKRLLSHACRVTSRYDKFYFFVFFVLNIHTHISFLCSKQYTDI